MNLGNYFSLIASNNKIFIGVFHKSKNFLNSPKMEVKTGLFRGIFEKAMLQMRI